MVLSPLNPLNVKAVVGVWSAEFPNSALKHRKTSVVMKKVFREAPVGVPVILFFGVINIAKTGV
jgi:hypothetical protein